MSFKPSFFDYELEEFDLNKLIKNSNGDTIYPRIAVIAKSGSGKSYVIRDLMYFFHQHGVSGGQVMCPTDKLNRFYDEFVPSVYIHHEVGVGPIHEFMETQEKRVAENERRIAQGKKPKNVKAFFVMDDCMANKDVWIKDDRIKDMFMNGRHFKPFPYILSMQYCKGITPDLRSNFDFIFLLGEDNHKNRRKLHEEYVGMIDNYHVFNELFTQMTDNYGCMVIDNRSRSADIRNRIFSFRAKVPPKFTIGCEKYIKFNQKKYDKNHYKRERENTLQLGGASNRQHVRLKIVKH